MRPGQIDLSAEGTEAFLDNERIGKLSFDAVKELKVIKPKMLIGKGKGEGLRHPDLTGKTA